MPVGFTLNTCSKPRMPSPFVDASFGLPLCKSFVNMVTAMTLSSIYLSSIIYMIYITKIDIYIYNKN